MRSALGLPVRDATGFLFDFFLEEPDDKLLFPDELGPNSGPEIDPEPVHVDDLPEFPEFPGVPATPREITEFLDLEDIPSKNN
jgi:hypothetical protein